MYYNTTKLTDADLDSATKKSESQEEKILAWFKKHNVKQTPFDVQSAILPNTPITSIRRAMTVLTADGLLIKLDELKAGAYGKENHLWIMR